MNSSNETRIKEHHTNDSNIKSYPTENEITTPYNVDSPGHAGGSILFSPQRNLSMQHMLSSPRHLKAHPSQKSSSIHESHPTPEHEQNQDQSGGNITNTTTSSNRREYNS